jgi:AcrR family transcriptional regulator
MTVGTRRQWLRAPDERRRQLLDAALVEFTEQGAATTVSAITTRAGVSKGTFYVYFESKEELLDQLRDDYVREYDAAMAEIGLKRSDEPVLEEMVRLSIDFLSSEFHAILFPTAIDLARGQRTVIDRLAALLGESNIAGITNVPDPQTFAILMVGAVNFAVRYLQDAGTYDRDQLVSAVIEMHGRMLWSVPHNPPAPA